MKKYLLEVRFETSKGNLFVNSLLEILVSIITLLDVRITVAGVAEESEAENGTQKAD